MQLGGVHWIILLMEAFHCITLWLWAVSTTVQVWDLWLEPHRYWQRPETKLGVMCWWGFSYKRTAPRSLGSVVFLMFVLLVCVLLLLLCLKCLIFVLTFGFLYYFWRLQLLFLVISILSLLLIQFHSSFSDEFQFCNRGFWFISWILLLVSLSAPLSVSPCSFFLANLWCTKCLPIQIYVWISFFK